MSFRLKRLNILIFYVEYLVFSFCFFTEHFYQRSFIFLAIITMVKLYRTRTVRGNVTLYTIVNIINVRQSVGLLKYAKINTLPQRNYVQITLQYGKLQQTVWAYVIDLRKYSCIAKLLIFSRQIFVGFLTLQQESENHQS